MKKLLGVLVLAALLPACGPEEDFISTPRGYSLSWHNVGAVEALYSIWGGRFEHGWTPPVVAGMSVSWVMSWEGECAYCHE